MWYLAKATWPQINQYGQSMLKLKSSENPVSGNICYLRPKRKSTLTVHHLLQGGRGSWVGVRPHPIKKRYPRRLPSCWKILIFTSSGRRQPSPRWKVLLKIDLKTVSTVLSHIFNHKICFEYALYIVGYVWFVINGKIKFGCLFIYCRRCPRMWRA